MVRATRKTVYRRSYGYMLGTNPSPSASAPASGSGEASASAAASTSGEVSAELSGDASPSAAPAPITEVHQCNQLICLCLNPTTPKQRSIVGTKPVASNKVSRPQLASNLRITMTQLSVVSGFIRQAFAALQTLLPAGTKLSQDASGYLYLLDQDDTQLPLFQALHRHLSGAQILFGHLPIGLNTTERTPPWTEEPIAQTGILQGTIALRTQIGKELMCTVFGPLVLELLRSCSMLSPLFNSLVWSTIAPVDPGFDQCRRYYLYLIFQKALSQQTVPEMQEASYRAALETNRITYRLNNVERKQDETDETVRRHGVQLGNMEARFDALGTKIDGNQAELLAVLAGKH